MIDFGMPTLIEIPDIEKSALLCRKLGLSFIELNMSFPQYQLNKLDPVRLKDIKEKYGVYFTIHLDESLDPCNVNDDIAKVYLESTLKTVELAKSLDIPVLNMHLLRGIYVTLPDRRTYVYAENMEYYLEKLKSFRDAVSTAIGDSGIRICIENTDGYALPFLKSALELLLESPAFFLTLDVGHDHAIAGADLPLILEHRDKLCHMHLHDANGSDVHLALGDGELDKDYYINLAKDCASRVVLETKTIVALERSAEWVNHWLNRSLSPDELWDVYNVDLEKTGATHKRGDVLGEGEYHLVVHCWLKNSKDEYLLTRRAPGKSYGGMWESPGGSALAGEDSLSAVMREIHEETGLELNANCGKKLLRYSRDHFICDVWLFTQDFFLEDIILQEGETVDAEYADADEIRLLSAMGQMVPYEYLEDILE